MMYIEAATATVVLFLSSSLIPFRRTVAANVTTTRRMPAINLQENEGMLDLVEGSTKWYNVQT